MEIGLDLTGIPTPTPLCHNNLDKTNHGLIKVLDHHFPEC
jgi:hypothetical protein